MDKKMKLSKMMSDHIKGEKKDVKSDKKLLGQDKAMKKKIKSKGC